LVDTLVYGRIAAAGHNLPEDAPAAFAQAMMDVDRL